MLTFFYANLSIAFDIIPDFKALLTEVQKHEDRSAAITAIIHSCDNPVALCKKLEEMRSLKTLITNANNFETLHTEYRTVQQALAEYVKEYPGKNIIIQARFKDGMFVILPAIY